MTRRVLMNKLQSLRLALMENGEKFTDDTDAGSKARNYLNQAERALYSALFVLDSYHDINKKGESYNETIQKQKNQG